MFENLTKKFGLLAKNLRGHGKLSEKNIQDALREVRLALLEADVHVGVVKELLDKIREQALGLVVKATLNPDEEFLRLVHQELTAILGGDQNSFTVNSKPPVVILMVGLQGSGKTTSAAKLALWLKKQGRHPYLVPADLSRPAAINQLQTLGAQLEIPCHPTVASDAILTIVDQALFEAKNRLSDVVIIDTAGRLAVDEPLMQELSGIHQQLLKKGIDPLSIRPLFVADAMLGQGAVKTAKLFHDRLPLNGVILTKMDGDARGGAALSIRSVLGVPLYFMGVGEKPDQFESFVPDRLVSRLLDRGDLMGLVEKAAEVYESTDEDPELTKRFLKSEFTLDDFVTQMKQMKKMGSLKSIMGFLPGAQKLADQVNFDQMEGEMKKKEAIIYSMTRFERRRPEVLNGSRRLRIAKGSGTQVSEVNRLLKEFGEMKKMMKSMKGKGGMKSLLKQRGLLG